MSTSIPTPLSSHDEVAFRSRIPTVFAGLTANGIDARQRFRCCTTCAVAELPTDAPWAYYHEQADDRIASGELWVGFGAPSDAETLQVGRTVLVLGLAQGLEAIWDGTTHSKVQLHWTGAPMPVGEVLGPPAGRPDWDELCDCGFSPEFCECECQLCGFYADEFECECRSCGHLLLDCLCDG